MATENKIPENILAALEAKKGSIAHIVGDKPSDCEVVVDESELDEGGD